MLKPYVSRDGLNGYADDIFLLDSVRDPEVDCLSDLLPSVNHTQGGTSGEHNPTVNMAPALANLVKTYADIFSDRPGRTNLATHSINLKPGTKVKIATKYQEKLNAFAEQFVNTIKHSTKKSN